MKIIVKKNSENNKKSCIRLFMYLIKEDKAFNLFFVFYSFILMLLILNNYGVVSFFVKTVEMLVFVLGAGILSMLLYFFFDILFIFKRVQRDSMNKFGNVIKYEFKDSGIRIIGGKGDDGFYYWNEFKGMLLLKDTLYIIPISKSNSFILLNQNEIIGHKVDTVVDFLQIKLVMLNKNNSKLV